MSFGSRSALSFERAFEYFPRRRAERMIPVFIEKRGGHWDTVEDAQRTLKRVETLSCQGARTP
jgi:hypothetical protein